MKTRIEKLKWIEAVLEQEIESGESINLASLVKQYRETAKEIEEIEKSKGNNDGISEILQRRAANGLPGSVRQNRS